MATYNWSTVPGGGPISFDPAPPYNDVLHFDGVETAGLGPDANEQFDFFTNTGVESVFSFGGKTVTLDVDPRKLTSSNITFLSGSLFIYGDNTTGTADDDNGNTINGDDFGDWLAGAGGDDTVNGIGGNDILDGGAGNDILDGGAGNDSMVGGLGDDTLIGGDGNDTLDGGTGNDSMIGGLGDDVYYVDAAGDTVVETAGQGTDTVYASVNETLDGGVDNLTLLDTASNGTGNSLANTITGNADDNVLNGGDGDDEILGLGGNDTLVGGAGNDTLDGGDGGDSMIGGAGDDLYYVIEAGDQAVEAANAGVDTIITNRDIVMDDNVDNLIWIWNGTPGFCVGNSLDNVMTGVGLGVSMDGGAGSDTVTYADQTQAVAVDLGAGTGMGADSVSGIENVEGGTNDDTLIGDDIDNVLDGNDGADSLAGGAGADSLAGGAGADTLQGGDGSDTYYVDDAGDVVLEADNNVPGGLLLPGGSGSFGPGLLDLTGITDTVIAAINFSVASLEFVENITLSGAAAQATGNALANLLTGNGGANVLDGRVGADTLIGGLGNDTYVVDNAGDVVTEAAVVGTDLVQSSVTIALLAANVEKLTLTGASAINGTGNGLANTLTGNGVDNVLNGGTGNDTMLGGAGNDTLNGEAGSDSMKGGGGNDTYIVNASGDVVTELSGKGTDTVKSSVTEVLSNHVDKLVLTGAEDIRGTGNSLANTLTGNSGNNVLDGKGGADILKGLGGNDTLVWSSGDKFNGGTGNDMLRFGSGNLNLKNVNADVLLSVEKVDLRADNVNVLTVTRQDVLDMSSTDKLTVLGDSGDQVRAAGFTQLADFQGFNRYKSGLAILLVETDVTVNI